MVGKLVSMIGIWEVKRLRLERSISSVFFDFGSQFEKKPFCLLLPHIYSGKKERKVFEVAEAAIFPERVTIVSVFSVLFREKFNSTRSIEHTQMAEADHLKFYITIITTHPIRYEVDRPLARPMLQKCDICYRDPETEIQTTNLRWFVRGVPTFDVKINTEISNSDAKDVGMLPLPIFWSSDSKVDGLRRLSEFMPADVTVPLKAHAELALSLMSLMAHTSQFCPCMLDQGIEVVECKVFKDSGQFAHLAQDCKSGPAPVQLSAVHDIGIPEQCTDLVYLIIDDLQQRKEANVVRYHRVWCRSGEVMLVSSTTTRSFNAAGLLFEVRQILTFAYVSLIASPLCRAGVGRSDSKYSK